MPKNLPVLSRAFDFFPFAAIQSRNTGKEDGPAYEN